MLNERYGIGLRLNGSNIAPAIDEYFIGMACDASDFPIVESYRFSGTSHLGSAGLAVGSAVGHSETRTGFVEKTIRRIPVATLSARANMTHDTITLIANGKAILEQGEEILIGTEVMLLTDLVSVDIDGQAVWAVERTMDIEDRVPLIVGSGVMKIRGGPNSFAGIVMNTSKFPDPSAGISLTADNNAISVSVAVSGKVIALGDGTIIDPHQPLSTLSFTEPETSHLIGTMSTKPESINHLSIGRVHSAGLSISASEGYSVLPVTISPKAGDGCEL